MRPVFVAWLERWQAAEQGCFALWLPVFMGSGVLCYFALRSEPPAWLGIAVAVPAVSGAWLFSQRPSCRVPLMALAAAAIGFAAAQFATLNAPPQPGLPTHATILTGTVRAVEMFPDGRRIALESASVDGAAPMARWLRVRLRKNDAQELRAC